MTKQQRDNAIAKLREALRTLAGNQPLVCDGVYGVTDIEAFVERTSDVYEKARGEIRDAIGILEGIGPYQEAAE